MRTAICLTPDRRFFGPALYTADRIAACGLPDDADLLLLCEPDDVWDGFDDFNSPARLILTDFAALIGDVPEGVYGSTAIYRRLVLDRVLPPDYARIIPVDSDMHVAREGLGPLIHLDLGDTGFAAAIDMIFLMQFGGPLAEPFAAYRAGLGLAPDCPYFNNGLTVIDRHAWRDAGLGARAIAFIRANPGLCQFRDQSALNALIKGRFMRLSPRYNFMGDFLILGLEREIAPAVYHFVNRPKPWEDGYCGDDRFGALYRDWFRASPWPDFPAAPSSPAPVSVNAAFRESLVAYLREQDFADGWAMP
ncbi:hypothetical protein BH10PSE7_BH10PSE7_08640 [soil metagenome]